MHRKGLVSIWFFIGVLLFIYGIIIVISDLTMETPHVIMADLRPGLWWGAFLTAIGAVYSCSSAPADAEKLLRWTRGQPVRGR